MRIRIRAVKEKGDNLLKYLFPNIYGAVNAIARLRPIGFANSNFPRYDFSVVAEFNVHEIPAQNYRQAMKRIAMPGSSFARG